MLPLVASKNYLLFFVAESKIKTAVNKTVFVTFGQNTHMNGEMMNGCISAVADLFGFILVSLPRACVFNPILNR
jgi:hypothetical protein